jgi:hypothetical protein
MLHPYLSGLVRRPRRTIGLNYSSPTQQISVDACSARDVRVYVCPFSGSLLQPPCDLRQTSSEHEHSQISGHGRSFNGVLTSLASDEDCRLHKPAIHARHRYLQPVTGQRCVKGTNTELYTSTQIPRNDICTHTEPDITQPQPQSQPRAANGRHLLLRRLLALQAAFMVSGAWHILVFWYNTRTISWRWAMFFIIQVSEVCFPQ